MFGSGDFWDKSPSRFFKIFKLLSVYLGNFKTFENALEQFIPKPLPNMWLLVQILYGTPNFPTNVLK